MISTGLISTYDGESVSTVNLTYLSTITIECWGCGDVKCRPMNTAVPNVARMDLLAALM